MSCAELNKMENTMTTIKTTVRNRRIDVPAPSDIPDGTEVMLTIAETGENEPLSPEEIARVLAAMENLEPLEIPEGLAADLEDWERKINQHGIEHRDPSMENVFP
jgi:hypothetical protein